MSSLAMKKSSLISIVNRLYLNANNEQIVEEDTVEEEADGNSVSMVKNEVKHSESSKSPSPILFPQLLSPEALSNGFSAIGGCRQCARTFSDRLSLIHHFVDHFPGIFYSFEPLNLNTNLNQTKIPSTTSSGFNFTSSFLLNAVTSANDSKNSTKSPILKKNKQKEKIKTTESPSRFTDFDKSSGDLPYDMCPHCCQTFADHQIYTEHLKTHDSPVISLGPQTGSSPMKCEYCDLRFSNEYLLKEHKTVHCRICSICSKTLMTAFDLNLHMGLHSGFNYDCKDCGRCFPDRKTLAIHNKMHRSDLSANDSEEERINKEQLSKENQKKVSFTRITVWLSTLIPE